MRCFYNSHWQYFFFILLRKKEIMHVIVGIKLGWSYAEKYLLFFLLNLSGICPDGDTNFFHPIFFFNFLNFIRFWTRFEKLCWIFLVRKLFWACQSISTMTGKYFKENMNCTHQEAENIKQWFWLVTVKEHDKFIVIPTSQSSALLHTMVT